MKPPNPRILTINGGSSSIKFALFEAGDSLRRILEGGIERIGLPETTLRVKGLNQADNFSRLVTAPDHTVAARVLYPFFGLLLRPIIVGAAMSLSSVSVISNALRLRKVRL
jgi:hypothetical protein